jgi:hypothetical protein
MNTYKMFARGIRERDKLGNTDINNNIKIELRKIRYQWMCEFKWLRME